MFFLSVLLKLGFDHFFYLNLFGVLFNVIGRDDDRLLHIYTLFQFDY